MVHFFKHPVGPIPLPDEFNNPFEYSPHPLCQEAAREVQEYLSDLDFRKQKPDEGKMFGVLIVQTPEHQTGFLAAFSGLLDGSYLHPYFVPPVYNLQQPEGFFRQEEQRISAINQQIDRLEKAPLYLKSQQELQQCRKQAEEALTIARLELKKNKIARDVLRHQTASHYDAEALIRESQHQKAEYKRLKEYWKAQILPLQNHTDSLASQIEALKTERKQRSATLQQKLFEQFRLLNARGDTKNVYEIFREYGLQLPPAGAGECAAPKLLQYAYQHQLHPIAMAEFWWGCSPKTEIRHPGNYYPACKRKCGPILSFMLQGLRVETASAQASKETAEFPEIVYEDNWLVVINKPAGMLTVPGKTSQISVYDLVHARYPAANGPLIVHRLDMATSGLLVVAKTKTAHANLQHQFLQQTVRKRYTALLEGIVTTDEGEISLPLCPDPEDRPRQIVSQQWGKPALTHYRVIGRTDHHTRVAFYPQTGRTHQLRVHAAHPLGLNCPIAGDALYGQKAERLYLHAEYLEFIHPITGKKIQLESKANF